jgi:hypothetical protein
MYVKSFEMAKVAQRASEIVNLVQQNELSVHRYIDTTYFLSDTDPGYGDTLGRKEIVETSFPSSL